MDYVVVKDQQLIPLEVKWTEVPVSADARHLRIFMDLYKVKQGYIICRTPRKMLIDQNIMVLPWHELAEVFYA